MYFDSRFSCCIQKQRAFLEYWAGYLPPAIQATNHESKRYNIWHCTHFWLSLESYPLKVASTNGWIMANINATGFFMVNYDKENWKKLTAQLREDHQVTMYMYSFLPVKKKFLASCSCAFFRFSAHLTELV